MKKVIRFIATVSILFLIVSGYPVTPNAEIPMGNNNFKTIRIKYEIKGKHQNGTEEFLQKGNKTYRKRYITTKIVANSFDEHTLEIDDGIFFYRINLINKTGIKLPSLNQIKQEMVEKNPHIFQNSDNNPLRITPSKGMIDVQETIQGKICQAYRVNSRTVFIWQDIILKETWEVFGTTIKTASLLELNQEISDKTFTPPNGISFKGTPEK